jgi:uroporphyrinogen decarboxylase
MEKMTKKERIKAALTGKPVDHAPVGFWRHWPGDDQDENSLALVTLEFQQHYDLDFIKFPVSSSYCVSDYGVKHEYQGNPDGTRSYLDRPIKKLKDWDQIEPLNVREGVYGWHLRSLSQVIYQRKPETPVVVTVFNPLAMAFYLAGDDTALAHLRQDPEKVKRALRALTQTCVDFVREAINAGVDGIFLSTKSASYELMNAQEYTQFDARAIWLVPGRWIRMVQHPAFSMDSIRCSG